jgi:hypothetical protein
MNGDPTSAFVPTNFITTQGLCSITFLYCSDRDSSSESLATKTDDTVRIETPFDNGLSGCLQVRFDGARSDNSDILSFMLRQTGQLFLRPHRTRQSMFVPATASPVDGA